MPPQKNDKKSTDKLRTIRKPKSDSKMPANLKICIPLRSTVARQQLVKEEPVFQVDNVVINTPKPKGKGKKFKVASDFFKNLDVMENNTAEVDLTTAQTKLPKKQSPAKKPSPIKNQAPTRKILTRKRLADAKAQEDAKRSKVEIGTVTETHDAIIKLEVNAVDEPVEPEFDSFVESLPTVVQSAPVVEHPTPEVVRQETEKSRCPVKRLPPTAKKPPPNRQSTPGRRRESKGKQQNLQASSDTPPTVHLLKNKVTESEPTGQNHQNSPGLVKSPESSVNSTPNLSRIQITVGELKSHQNQLIEQKTRKNSVGNNPLLLKDQLTEVVVKTKNASGLGKCRNKSVGSSPRLLKKNAKAFEVKTNQSQVNAPGIAKPQNNSAVSSPNLFMNKVTEAEVKSKRRRESKGKQQNLQASSDTPPTVHLLKNKVTECEPTGQNHQNAPGLVKSRESSVNSTPNLSRNQITEGELKTIQNQLIEQKTLKNSVGNNPLLLKDQLTEAVVKTKNASGLGKCRNKSVGSSPRLLKKNAKVFEVKTNLSQVNAPGIAKSQNNSAVSSPNFFINKLTEAEVKSDQNKLNAPATVNSRKNSVSSGSNKSWTKDISSSSNTTCIGSVCSNDFVCINNKLPVLKLTNIDSEVKKRQKKAQEIASGSVDETDEDLSDSDDSDDSSDGEERFSEQLLGANSLHLSASSSSQFTQFHNKERSSDNPKGNSSDYGKPTNKLSLTMEELDLEIMKWMNSDNENVNANLIKFRDKMFDILDREFGVVMHCRHLKEMLNPPNKGGSVEESCILKQVQDFDANNDVAEENSPAVGDNPIMEKVPVLQNEPVVEHIPVAKKTSAVENFAVGKKVPFVENPPAVINAPVVENIPVNDNTPVENHTRELVKDLSEPKRRTSRHQSRVSEGEFSISNASTNLTSDEETAPGTSYPYYDHHDDDDTLSLFAESISGFESSKQNVSVASVGAAEQLRNEEYIPKPVKIDHVADAEKQRYCPTKIRKDPEMTASKIVNVCEKQNADSTSIYKQSISTDDAESYQDITENIELDSRLGPPDMIKKPRLMDSYYEAMPKARSVMFNNLCFYNLMNCCRNHFYGQCRFLHVVPTSAQIKEKLKHLDEKMLIQEYLLLRQWADLRRRYGVCYVEECAKRGLTRILVEMAYDCIVKARNNCEEDTRCRVNAIELTLLHLNNVDLSICEDLLKLVIRSDQANRTLLCDVLMATMSITQNFSRFKIVFLNLTYFMVDNDRTFNKDVVEHILERVCILPFEEPIARALIQMMRLTKSDIFNNSMIGHFEKQISVNKDVFEDYTLLKNQWAFSSMLASSVLSPSPPLQATTTRPTAAAPVASPEPQPPAASPDTTNLDNMNRAAEELSKPVITRTIGMNPTFIFKRTALGSGDSRACVSPGDSRACVSPGDSRARVNPGLSTSSSNPGPSKTSSNSESDDSDDSNKLKVRQWRNRSIFRQILPPPIGNQPYRHGTPIRGASPRACMRPPMWPPMRPPQRSTQRSMFKQRQVTFKSPSNYGHRQTQPGSKY